MIKLLLLLSTLRAGQIPELLKLPTEKECVEFSPNVLPKVW